jgi:hypothetical protein
MRTLLVVAVAVAVIVAAIFVANVQLGKKEAKGRVTGMMDGWVAGGLSADGHVQEAVMLWYDGTKYPPDNELLLQASADFDAWRRAKKLFREIDGYTIERVVSAGTRQSPEFHVFIDIEGEPYGLKVIDGEPIEWLD